ncbi:MAG: S41 family peptidase [Candidatus Kapaibacterium sp.]
MRKVLFGMATITVGVLVGFLVQPLISSDNVYEQVRKFSTVLNTASKNYVEDVDTYKLTEEAIVAMLKDLDVHSVYITPKQKKEVDEDFRGNFDGIGVQFDIINDTITIISPIPGGPSEALGIMSGDKIVKIDGENAVGIDRSDVPKRLKGPKGTIVEIDIKRSGEPELIHYEITRDKIPLYSVDAAFMIDSSDIGVIITNRFSATTYDELREALDKLRKQGMKKLVLDLRNNPGGYLSQAFYVADEFLPGGDTIVFTQGRRDNFNEAFMSTTNGSWEDQPIIVMVNAGSASASEIVSGAIQDLDRGLVVGTTSFGKGLVQRQYEIGDGSAFRLTISKYYTPSGRCIQRPYKDADKYRHLVGRVELEEGMNIEHALEKVKKEVKQEIAEGKDGSDEFHIDSLPIYHTLSGRVVLGGGGIVPDYIVKSDTINRLSILIRNKNLFFEFVNNRMNDELGRIEKKYKNDFKSYFRNYQISDQMMNDFKELAQSKIDEWNDDQFKSDREYLLTALKANIANKVWDRNHYLQVFYTMDRQLNTAVTLFDEAQKIAGGVPRD